MIGIILFILLFCALALGVPQRAKTPTEKAIEFWNSYKPYEQTLDREEQIELMKECYKDANIVVARGSIWAPVHERSGIGAVAAAFFEYRTKGR